MTQLDVRSAKRADKARLGELLQEYLAEFATFEHIEQHDDGSYVYPYFDHYWEDPNRYPFLFRQGDAPAGFALLRFDIDPATGRESMEMAEFYIRPDFRRSGAGRAAATQLWELFPGRWIVRVLKSNKNAYPFWKTVIAAYTEGRYEEQAPATAIGGAFTFTFESATDAEIPDDLDIDFLDY